jgi:hypothetical protein
MHSSWHHRSLEASPTISLGLTGLPNPTCNAGRDLLGVLIGAQGNHRRAEFLLEDFASTNLRFTLFQTAMMNSVSQTLAPHEAGTGMGFVQPGQHHLRGGWHSTRW